MLVTSYLDFELEIKENRDAGITQRYRAAVYHSPHGGTPHEYFDAPFSIQEIKELYEKTNLRSDSANNKSFTSYGQQLFDTVFTGQIRNNFEHSLQRAKTKGRGLRLCLRLDSVPEIADWPWEYLRDNQSFLAHDPFISIVRYLDLPNRPEPLPIESSLNMLVVIANPRGTEQLDVMRERRLIEDTLRDLVQQELVTIDWLESATMESLRRQLPQRQYHILHFIGHGSFDENRKEGYLLFADANGDQQKIFSEDLKTAFLRYEWLRLCILNSCDSGRNGVRAFDGVAQGLTGIGIPAVIAMQFKIEDSAAITFTEEFYKHLSQKLHVDAALHKARLLIKDRQGSNRYEWGTPVLHMRVQDGNLWSKRVTLSPPALPSPPLPPTPSVSRRAFISATIGTSIIGFSGGWFASQRAKPVHWKMASFLGDNAKGLILHKYPQAICDRISQLTGGGFKIEITEKNPDTDEILDHVKIREVECGYSGIYYSKEAYAPLYFSCAIPFGLSPQEQTAWLDYKIKPDDKFTFMQTIYQKAANVIAFPAGATGAQMGGWFKNQTSTLVDLKNIKKMRIPGLGAKVFEELEIGTDTSDGGKAISVDKIYNSLKNNEIGAAEWIGPYDDYFVLKLHEVAPYYYYPGWWEPSTTFDLQVNIDAWNELTEENQEILKLVCREAYVKMLAEYDQKNSEAWQKIQEDKSFHTAKFSPEILNASLSATQTVLERYRKRQDFEDVYVVWNSFRQKLKGWSEVRLEMVLNKE